MKKKLLKAVALLMFFGGMAWLMCLTGSCDTGEIGILEYTPRAFVALALAASAAVPTVIAEEVA